MSTWERFSRKKKKKHGLGKQEAAQRTSLGMQEPSQVWQVKKINTPWLISTAFYSPYSPTLIVFCLHVQNF